jgi:predicted nuclease of restriction endonuclease-like (RecB) superfamily
MKEKRPATQSKPSAGTSRGRKTSVTETKESGRGVVLPAQSDLFASVSGLIEEARRTLARQANSTTLCLFWRIGQQVNSEILHHQRAEYGQKIVTTLATQLVASYGRSFEARNLRRMMQFAEQFPDFVIVSPLATQLSWSHVVEVLALKTPEARLFYLGEAATRQLGKRELRRMIDRKAFERKEIANAQLTEASAIALDTFKDPYLLDVLGLHDGFLEADLEAAVLRELESFILELGGGFTFVARQKRMIIGGEDFHLDLLFFHRRLKRLVAVELKIGKFEAEHSLLRKSRNRIRFLLSNNFDEFHIFIAQRLGERFHTREPNLRIAWLRFVLTSGNSNGSGPHFILRHNANRDYFHVIPPSFSIRSTAAKKSSTNFPASVNS